MILKVTRIWVKLGLNYSFASKGHFSGKLTTITFVYVVRPIMLLHFKKILRADHKISGNIILVQIESKLPICPKRDFFFWQNLLLLLSTYCILSCYSISKIFSERKSRDRRLHNFGPNWVRVTCPKGKSL